MAEFELLRAERDAVAFLGLLTHAYLTWDAPIPVTEPGGKAGFTHFGGLNIQALIVDNLDGEVLAMTKNSIHQTESPVNHAEQAAVRVAAERIRTKRPRASGTTVEDYYRNELFYKAGPADEDFVRKGSTLYTTLEPCPMCAATLLVCRMKRVVHLIPDKKFGGSFVGLKDRYYDSYELRYDLLGTGGGSPLLERTAGLHAEFSAEIERLRVERVQDTQFLDRLHGLLARAMQALLSVTEADLSTSGNDCANVARTLSDLRRHCRLP
jgi:tRNA(Arg) A34 adenosine deaminase TadA